MCGRLNVSDDPFVLKLIKELGCTVNKENILWSRFKKAGDQVSIIRENENNRELSNATWWLLLDKTQDAFKLSKYASFNTRSDKLNTPNSAGYKAFRSSRCIIPVKGFGETEFVNKKPLHYYDMEAVEGESIALGGLCREWMHPSTGEIALSCSVITLPPHPKLQAIHKKSMPLILPNTSSIRDLWLDKTVSNIEVFNELLTPHIPQELNAYPINKPSLYQQIGDSFVITADK